MRQQATRIVATTNTAANASASATWPSATADMNCSIGSPICSASAASAEESPSADRAAR